MSEQRLTPDIPKGTRVVARVFEGIDPDTHRPSLRDYVGHVVNCTAHDLDLVRDAAANGSRPAEGVRIPISAIVALKHIPERPIHHADRSSTSNA